MIKFLLFPFLLISFTSFSQINFSGEANTRAMLSTGEKLPFWMHHNTRGRIAENTNIVGWVTGKGVYDLGYYSRLEFGAGILARDGDNGEAFIDELYAHLELEKFYITVGRKQQAELYNGLSASNRSILWSLNARPLPGIQIGTNGPLFLAGDQGFGIEGSWNEYLLEKDRFVSNANLHHKNLLLVYRFENSLQIKAGLQHFVQWGGVSPVFGQQPITFKDYLKVVTGRGGSETAPEGDQQNALGNHLGGYEIFIGKEFSEFRVELLYNHLFEDGSGRRLGNTPDGRYGIYMEMKDRNRIINSFIYEFYYTEHQSHTTTGVDGADNYFNNTIYRSGWTFENRVLGVPFFTVNPEEPGIINNKFKAHHIGIGGDFSNTWNTWPYKFMLSLARNDGRFTRRFRPVQDVAYVHFEYGLLRSFLDLDIQVGAEYNSFSSPIYGVGLQVRKEF